MISKIHGVNGRGYRRAKSVTRSPLVLFGYIPFLQLSPTPAMLYLLGCPSCFHGSLGYAALMISSFSKGGIVPIS